MPACVKQVSNNFNHTVAKYVRFVANLLCQLCVYICVSMCQTCAKRVSKPVPTTCQLVSKYIKLLPNLCQHCVKIVSTVVKLYQNVINLCQHVSNVCQNLPKTCVNICVNLCQHVPNLCQNLCKHVTAGWLFRSAPKRCPRVPKRLPKGLKQV